MVDQNASTRTGSVWPHAAGAAPYALAVEPGSSRVYVANEAGDERFAIVDTTRP